MQPLSQLLLCPGRTRRSPCPKTCSAASAWPPGWVHVVPAGAHSPFAPIAPDSGPSFYRAAPESPTVGKRTPLPHSGRFSLQPAPEGGVRPGREENQERSRNGVSSWSAPSSDLGLPSLLLMLPATRVSSSPCPLPNCECSFSSAVDQSHQGSGQNIVFQGGHTNGPWEFELLSSSLVDWDAGGLWTHFEKHLTDLSLTSVSPE